MQENIVEAVRDLQREIGFGNAAKGFHEEGVQTIIDYVDVVESDPSNGGPELRKKITQDYRRYAAQRIMLVVTELSEAFEEVRDGRSMTETYYSNKNYPGERFYLSPDGNYRSDADDDPRVFVDSSDGMKPEGVPSELADVLIRVLDIGDEFGIDLAAMAQEKLAYNASRPKMHGREF